MILTSRDDYRRGFALGDCIYTYCAFYIHTTRDYKQYSSIAVLHVLQFTDVHIPRYPGNGFIIVSLSLKIMHELPFTQSNLFIAISSQSSSTNIVRTRQELTTPLEILVI
jgi:hypothetical protein